MPYITPDDIRNIHDFDTLLDFLREKLSQVAKHLGVDRMSVGQWLRAYETGGLEKLLLLGYPDC